MNRVSVGVVNKIALGKKKDHSLTLISAVYRGISGYGLIFAVPILQVIAFEFRR